MPCDGLLQGRTSVNLRKKIACRIFETSSYEKKHKPTASLIFMAAFRPISFMFAFIFSVYNYGLH